MDVCTSLPYQYQCLRKASQEYLKNLIVNILYKKYFLVFGSKFTILGGGGGGDKCIFWHYQSKWQCKVSCRSRNLRLPPWCSWDLGFSGMLRGVRCCVNAPEKRRFFPFKVQSSFYQQMHPLLNIKMLKLTIKISLYSLLHASVHSDHPQGAYAEPC
jgi:hypothetical protein